MRSRWLAAAIGILGTAACGGGPGAATTDPFQTSTSVSQPQPSSSTSETVHPFIADIAESRGWEIPAVERKIQRIAVEEGVDVEFLLGLGDFSDLLSPVSLMFEEIRRELPGEFLEDLCPLGSALAGTSSLGGAAGRPKIVVVSGFDQAILGNWRDAREEDPGRFVEQYPRAMRSAVHRLAAGDTSHGVDLGPPGDSSVEFPEEWLADSYDEIALIVCVGLERTNETIKECSYRAGSQTVVFDTRRLTARIEVYESVTGTLVAEMQVPGPDVDDPECTLILSLPDSIIEEAREGPLVRSGPEPTAEAIIDALTEIVDPAD